MRLPYFNMIVLKGKTNFKEKKCHRQKERRYDTAVVTAIVLGPICSLVGTFACTTAEKKLCAPSVSFSSYCCLHRVYHTTDANESTFLPLISVFATQDDAATAAFASATATAVVSTPPLPPLELSN